MSTLGETYDAYNPRQTPQTGTFMSQSRYSTHDTSVCSRSEVFYEVLSLAQTRSVDFLHITQQANLGILGAGATAAVLQSYVNPRMSLAFKGPDDSQDEFSKAALERFLKELYILSIPAFRTHSFIATLEGIAWKVRDEDSLIVPLLVFEKASFGNLKEFMQKREKDKKDDSRERRWRTWPRSISGKSSQDEVEDIDGQQTELKGCEFGMSQRLDLCCQLASAMYHLERHDGALFVRVTDFGHASIVDGNGGPIRLPESKPWTIPAPEYHRDEYSFDAATKAMVYSLGVCCLWLLLYNKPDDTNDDFDAEVDNAKATRSQAWMLDLAKKRLHPSEWISSALGSLLRALFQLTLEPYKDRAASAKEVLILLHQARALAESSSSSPRYTSNDVKVARGNYLAFLNVMKPDKRRPSIKSLDTLRFKVPLAMLFLHDVDYRVREAILCCIRECEAVRRKDGLTNRWKQHCVELAICHRLGFGTKRDVATALAWLRMSEANNADFDDGLGMIHWYPAAPYTPWTRWSGNFNTDTVAGSYDLSYYLGRQSLGTVLRVQRRELDDWSAALGPQHWIVLEKQHMLVSFELAKGNASQAELMAREAYRVVIAMEKRPDSFIRLIKARISLTRVSLFYRRCEEAEGLARELLSSLLSSSNEVSAVRAPDHYQYVAEAKHLLASAYEGQSKFRSAIKLRRENLATAEARLGDQHPWCFEHMIRLAVVIRQSNWRGNAHPEPKALLRRAERLAKKGYGNDHHMAQVARQHQQILLRNILVVLVRRDPDQFKPELIEQYQTTLGNFSPTTINAMDHGVELLLQRHRVHEALKLMEQVVRLAAVTYQHVPAQLDLYANRYRGVLVDVRIAPLFGNYWYLDYANIPIGFDRFINNERFHRRYELMVWPIYKVKERFKKYEPFSFDCSKDPDYCEQDKDSTPNPNVLLSEILGSKPRLMDYIWGPKAYSRIQII